MSAAADTIAHVVTARTMAAERLKRWHQSPIRGVSSRSRPRPASIAHHKPATTLQRPGAGNQPKPGRDVSQVKPGRCRPILRASEPSNKPPQRRQRRSVLDVISPSTAMPIVNRPT
ncbi:MAG TPA: hypothetical protein DCE47_09245 [Planctomycetaceae bacterium]|nr:hypothetical protein [Planctomycetaceae bacterium]